MPNLFTHLTLELRNLPEVSGIGTKTASVLSREHLRQPMGNEGVRDGKKSQEDL